MIQTHDQLTDALAQAKFYPYTSANYPNYEEAPINFLPSYKLSKTELVYVDKKDQAPSYCDRVLFKNNTTLELSVESYDCLHDVYGSDHRPVALSLSIRDFGWPQYYEMPKMNEQPSYGIFDIEYVNIEELRWNEIPSLAAKVNLPQLVDDL